MSTSQMNPKMSDQMLGLHAIAKTTTLKERRQKEERKRKQRLEIGPIDGVIPYAGVRNPLTRSNTSYKSGMLLRTKANGYRPAVVLNDSEAEEATKIEAILLPNVRAVTCQPLTIRLPGGKGKALSHTYDIGIELDCGRKKLVYVKSQISLSSRVSNSRIEEIVRHTPKDAADEIVVISDMSFSRVYRDNNRRILMCHQMPNPDADEGVVELVNHCPRAVRVEDIVNRSGLPQYVAWQAIMRMVGAGRIRAERDFVIDYASFIWSAN